LSPTRSQLASFGLSLAAHAAFVALAGGLVWTAVEPRPLLRVALLPGGGGAGGVAAGGDSAASAAAVQEAAPSRPQAQPRSEEVRPRKRVAARKRPVDAPPRARASAGEVAPAAPASAPAQPHEVGGAAPPGDTGVGGGGGEGSGAGGGSGGGAGGGAGSGRGRGAGQDLDLRLYCLSCPEPQYPRLARARGWQGATDVELTVLADGRVDEAMVRRSSGFDVLDRAALDVAMQSRFSPPEEIVRGRLAYQFLLTPPRR